MKKVIKLTESDINRIVRKVLNENIPTQGPQEQIAAVMTCLQEKNVKVTQTCQTAVQALLSGKMTDPSILQCGFESMLSWPTIMSCVTKAAPGIEKNLARK